jgi:hypothetical protein
VALILSNLFFEKTIVQFLLRFFILEFSLKKNNRWLLWSWIEAVTFRRPSIWMLWRVWRRRKGGKRRSYIFRQIGDRKVIEEEFLLWRSYKSCQTVWRTFRTTAKTHRTIGVD